MPKPVYAAGPSDDGTDLLHMTNATDNFEIGKHFPALAKREPPDLSERMVEFDSSDPRIRPYDEEEIKQMISFTGWSRADAEAQLWIRRVSVSFLPANTNCCFLML